MLCATDIVELEADDRPWHAKNQKKKRCDASEIETSFHSKPGAKFWNIRTKIKAERYRSPGDGRLFVLIEAGPRRADFGWFLWWVN